MRLIKSIADSSNIPYFIITLLIGYYLFFFPAINEGIIGKQVKYFLTIPNSSYLADIFFAGILILTLILFISKWQSRANADIRKQDFLLPIIIFTIFTFHRLHVLPGQDWEYAAFKSVPYLRYADSIVLFALIISFKPRKRIPICNFESNFIIEDNVYAETGIDVLGRIDYAKAIAGHINTQGSKNSLAIGITGNWGAGKSVFLEQIRTNLDPNLLTYQFNPWLSKDSLSIVDDFFKGISELILPYNRNLSKRLQKYSNSILGTEKDYKEKANALLNIMGVPLNALENQRETIRAELGENKLKIVVFIDDVDRLTGDEAFAILSLIRNSFNFPNVFFIVAYDHNYLVSLVTNKEIPFPADFLQKIFQHEIDLPSFPSDILKKQLFELIKKEKTEKQILEIEESLDIIEKKESIISLMNNLRGIVRLANSINILFPKKYSQVDLVDFMLLEILKLSDRKTYTEIRNCLLLEIKLPYVGFVRASIQESFSAYFRDAEDDKDRERDLRINALLKMLFNRETDNMLKRLKNGDNVLRYFSDDLFGSISFEEFDVYMMSNGDIEFKTFIENSIENGNANALKILIPRVQRFKNIHELSNFLKGVLFFSNTIDAYFLIDSNLIKKNLALFKGASTDELRVFISKLVEADTFPFLSESILFGSLIDDKAILAEMGCSSSEYNIIRGGLIQCLRAFINQHSSFDTRSVLLYKNAIKKTPYEEEVYYSTSLAHREYKYYLEYTFESFIHSINFNGNEGIEFPSYIDECMGWVGFREELISAQDTLQRYRIETFFNKFSENDYKPVKVNPLMIWIVSDEATKYIGSTFEEHLIEKTKIVTREAKLEKSKKYQIFNHSKWISHLDVLPLEESIKGGVYTFRRIVNLESDKFILKSAVLHLLVDDFVKLIINGDEIPDEYQGFDSLSSVDITDYLNPNFYNTIDFLVRNVSGDREIIEENIHANPYDLIYTIIIQLSEK